MRLGGVGAVGVHADQLLGQGEPLPSRGGRDVGHLRLRQSVRLHRHLNNTSSQIEGVTWVTCGSGNPSGFTGT